MDSWKFIFFCGIKSNVIIFFVAQIVLAFLATGSSIKWTPVVFDITLPQFFWELLSYFHTIFIFPVWLMSKVIPSRSIQTVTNADFPPFHDWILSHCMFKPQILYPCIHQWTLKFFCALDTVNDYSLSWSALLLSLPLRAWAGFKAVRGQLSFSHVAHIWSTEKTPVSFAVPPSKQEYRTKEFCF